MARMIAEILATEKDRKRGGEPSEAKDEEEEEIPFIRKPRSARIAVTGETPIQMAKEDDLVPAEEDTPTPMEEEKGAEGEPVDRKRYERERKRKGKQLERPIKKKGRQAARNVVIQEPIQVPHKQDEEEWRMTVDAVVNKLIQENKKHTSLIEQLRHQMDEVVKMVDGLVHDIQDTKEVQVYTIYPKAYQKLTGRERPAALEKGKEASPVTGKKEEKKKGKKGKKTPKHTRTDDPKMDDSGRSQEKQ